MVVLPSNLEKVLKPIVMSQRDDFQNPIPEQLAILHTYYTY